MRSRRDKILINQSINQLVPKLPNKIWHFGWLIFFYLLKSIFSQVIQKILTAKHRQFALKLKLEEKANSWKKDKNYMKFLLEEQP